MKIQHILEECKKALKEEYGNKLKDIILYGSWARGTATEDSDIDLLIILDGEILPGKEIDRMIDIITDINLKYGVLLSVYPMSNNDYTTINSPLLINVRKEGKAA